MREKIKVCEERFCRYQIGTKDNEKVTNYCRFSLTYRAPTRLLHMNQYILATYDFVDVSGGDVVSFLK